MQKEYSSLPSLREMAIITGGSRGNGAGIALELATRGANIGADNPS